MSKPRQEDRAELTRAALQCAPSARKPSATHVGCGGVCPSGRRAGGSRTQARNRQAATGLRPCAAEAGRRQLACWRRALSPEAASLAQCKTCRRPDSRSLSAGLACAHSVKSPAIGRHGPGLGLSESASSGQFDRRCGALGPSAGLWRIVLTWPCAEDSARRPEPAQRLHCDGRCVSSIPQQYDTRRFDGRLARFTSPSRKCSSWPPKDADCWSRHSRPLSKRQTERAVAPSGRAGPGA